MRPLLFLALACSTVLSCTVPPPKPAPSVPPPVAPPVNTVTMLPPPAQSIVQPTGHWLDWPMSQGAWVYRQDERGSIALFGPVGGDALVTLRCDKRVGRVFLSRRGNNGGTLTVRTSSTSKSIAVLATGGIPAYVAADLQPTDPLLDAMGYSRGRVALEVPGLLNIAIPVWAEIGRVTEDCRS
jgi:hypothetical protein